MIYVSVFGDFCHHLVAPRHETFELCSIIGEYSNLTLMKYVFAKVESPGFISVNSDISC